MAKCRFLEGENLAPLTASSARALIGKRVKYLRERDIDKSGRGFFFPQDGVVADVYGRNIAFDHEHNFQSIHSIRELVLMDSAND